MSSRGRGRGVSNAPAWMTKGGGGGGGGQSSHSNGPSSSKPHADSQHGGGGGDRDSYHDHLEGGGRRTPPRGGGGDYMMDYGGRGGGGRYDDGAGWYGGGGGGGGNRRDRDWGGRDTFRGGDERRRGGGGGGRNLRNEGPRRGGRDGGGRNHGRGDGGGGGNRSGIYFHSLAEERAWVEERRHKRRERKSLFDVEPTEEQKALEEIQKAASAAGGTSSLAFTHKSDSHATNHYNSSYNDAHSDRGGDRNNGDRGSYSRDRNSSGRISVQPQQTRHARRLYIGHLPVELTEEDVHTFFRDSIYIAMSTPNPTSEDDPILNVYINKERRFAFVEFKTMEVCTACLALDGINVCGKGKVKVKRPNDYNPALAPPTASHSDSTIQKFDVSKLGIVSGTVPDGPNKIFIGGLPYHLTEEEVMELLSAFGSVKAFHLVKADPTALTSKGYCFVEYADETVTPVAVMGLNGMGLGGGKVLSARIAAARGDGDDGASTATSSSHPNAAAASSSSIKGLAVPGIGTVAPIVPSTSAPGIPGLGGSTIPPTMKVVDGVDVEALLDAAMGLAPMPSIASLTTTHASVNVNVAGASAGMVGAAQANAGLYYGSNTTIAANPAVDVAAAVAVGERTVLADNGNGGATATATATPVLDIANAALEAAFGSSDVTVESMNGQPQQQQLPPPSNTAAAAPSTTATRVLVLLNMVTDDDFASQEDYQGLVDEVREECEKFGRLVSMKIPKPQDPYAASSIKKIFLEYATVNDSMNAERELAGRQFGPAVVEATYFNEEDYASGKLA